MNSILPVRKRGSRAVGGHGDRDERRLSVDRQESHYVSPRPAAGFAEQLSAFIENLHEVWSRQRVVGEAEGARRPS